MEEEEEEEVQARWGGQRVFRHSFVTTKGSTLGATTPGRNAPMKQNSSTKEYGLHSISSMGRSGMPWSSQWFSTSPALKGRASSWTMNTAAMTTSSQLRYTNKSVGCDRYAFHDE